MLNNKKVLFFIMAASIFTGLCLLNVLVLSSTYKDLFIRLNKSTFEPIFVLSAALLASSIVLLFFSGFVFKVWFFRIFSWFFSVAIILTFLTNPAMSYAFPNRIGIATLLGETLVAITIVFALIQRFWYKR